MSVNSTVARMRVGCAVDAGQEGLDLVEGNLRCFPKQGRVHPRQLHQFRPRDVVGQVASVPDGDELSVASMQDQRWCLDQRQDRPHVDLQHRPHQLLSGLGAGPSANHLPQPTTKPLVASSAGRHHRHHGLGAPKLIGLSCHCLSDLGGKPDRVVVGGHKPGCGVRQDKGAHALWLGCGEDDGRRASVEFGQQRGPLSADFVQDRG
jgi:hypothetical protein